MVPIWKIKEKQGQPSNAEQRNMGHSTEMVLDAVLFHTLFWLTNTKPGTAATAADIYLDPYY
jgi:hypothetical protein